MKNQSSSSSSSSSSSAPVATVVSPEAVVINNNNNQYHHVNATAISASPSSGNSIPISAVPLSGPALRNDIGVCRGCGQQFVRPVGCHDAQAQYFRCQECCKLKLTDFCIVS